MDLNEYWAAHLKKNNGSDLTRIRQLYPLERVITVDVSKIIDNVIHGEVLDKPTDQIDIIKQEAIGLGTIPKDAKLVIRFVGVTKKTEIRNLRSNADERHLRSIAGLVKRVTIVQPKIIQASYQCRHGHFSIVQEKHDRIIQPKFCKAEGCKERDLFYADREVKISRQFIYVQEPMENLKGGIQPASLRCEVTEDLCNFVTTGERVILNGIYRSIPKFKEGYLQAGKDFYFEVNSIEREECGYDEVRWTDRDEVRIKELAADPAVFERLTASIAPSIVGMKLFKQAIVLLLFGGVTRTMPDGTRRRGHINVLCVTDPGMAKTIILKFVEQVAPRGVYASAVTASKVGMVAPIVRDEITGQYAIEPGPYMLANGGVFCLDEASEISKDDAKYIGECMENGECHITKVVNALIKTECPLLAACNPEDGSFDPKKPYAKQIKMPDSILSRFDIKILLLDIQDEDKDRKMAEFISGTFLQKESSETDARTVPPELLRKYIAYSRQINPSSTLEANRILDAYWVKIRKECGNNERMKITHRQLAACHHLAEAHARMRLSAKVEVDDAQAAIDLFDMCFRNVNTDIQGRLNMAMSEKHIRSNLPDLIIKTIKDIGGDTKKASEMSVTESLKKQGYGEDQITNTIRRMLQERESRLMEPTSGLLKVI